MFGRETLPPGVCWLDELTWNPPLGSRAGGVRTCAGPRPMFMSDVSLSVRQEHQASDAPGGWGAGVRSIMRSFFCLPLLLLRGGGGGDCCGPGPGNHEHPRTPRCLFPELRHLLLAGHKLLVDINNGWLDMSRGARLAVPLCATDRVVRAGWLAGWPADETLKAGGTGLVYEVALESLALPACYLQTSKAGFTKIPRG